jgi:hypothetical protein
VRVVYNYFRTYDPSTGRYLESDPIGLAGGLNLYGYAANAPVMYTDTYGLFLDETGKYLLQCAKTGVGAAVSAVSVAVTGIGLLLTPNSTAPCDQPFPPEENDCPTDDDCAVLIARIKAHIAAMRVEHLRLLVDKHNLFSRALLRNPGGDLAGLGTWHGHIVRYRGLMKGLRKMVNDALIKGCALPPDAYSGQAGHPFRLMPATDSGGCRSATLRLQTASCAPGYRGGDRCSGPSVRARCY